MAFKIIPANAVAFARFNLGNKITNALGIEVASQTDMNLSLLDEPAKDVLREAVANARKAGRNYVEYKDYPAMASGERPEKFYSGKRSARNYFDLYVESATDPVFEMFTSVGGFRFQDSPDGGFVIPNDPYDFDRSKSPKSRKAKDDYSKAVYAAQDIDQTYRFSLSGTIPPKGGSKLDTNYIAKFVRAAYDTVSDTLLAGGKILDKQTPYEFNAIMREGIDRFAAALPEVPEIIDLAEVDFPDMPNLPEFVSDLQARVVNTGYNISNKIANGFDIDFNVPRLDVDFGDILDVDLDFDVERPRLPVAALSTDRLAQAKGAVESAFQAMKPADPEDLTFSQAFARNRSAGKDQFEWRGDMYHTRYQEEMDVQEA